ncbi:hypothetical protein [Marinobacterium rhizophilum]|uniref:Uncharacterized protein n=1 Tax=Marinobacterium rhizophilum TaxID=420402 RepID=A0ABY5HM35_9GAMM|nr:hypothetical protein [Marinobacterium rhizophilum]UTW11976.1 hypothetical protein KDW95_22535 [Marinobacterium rhizophilum]
MRSNAYLHSATELQRLEPELSALIEPVDSEQLFDVQRCRHIAQQSYATHSVVIPKNPLVVSSADAAGIWVTAMVFLPADPA